MLGCSGLNGEFGLGGFPVVSYKGEGFPAGWGGGEGCSLKFPYEGKGFLREEALIEAGFDEKLGSCLFMVGVMVWQTVVLL